MRVLTILVASLVTACGSDPTEQTPTETEFHPGLQEDGAIAFERAAASAKLPEEKKEQVSISAPIWPDVLTMYKGEGASYPTTADGEAKLAKDSALPFSLLISKCKAKYTTIAAPGDSVLSAVQISNNYNEVAKCAYEQFTAKPYWIPQLVDDVDICKAQLGGDWRLLSAADIAGFSAEQLKFLADTLSATGSGAEWAFYYSLDVWARGADGKIVKGSLNPGSAGTSPLPATVDGSSKTHLESDLALRCIKTHIP